MTRDDIFRGVRECLAAALDIPAESIQLDSKVIEDLGADSLDLLDATFHLEQRFKVSISPREVERRAREALQGAPLDVDGVYTPEALAEIRRLLPEIPAVELSDGLRTIDLPRRLRVESLVNLVERLLRGNPGVETGRPGGPAAPLEATG
jgi:acyl carrier protein